MAAYNKCDWLRRKAVIGTDTAATQSSGVPRLPVTYNLRTVTSDLRPVTCDLVPRAPRFFLR